MGIKYHVKQKIHHEIWRSSEIKKRLELEKIIIQIKNKTNIKPELIRVKINKIDNKYKILRVDFTRKINNRKEQIIYYLNSNNKITNITSYYWEV